MLRERGQRHDVERARARRREHDERRRAVLVGAQPVGDRHAPAVAGHEAGEAEPQHRRREVVADAVLVLEELGRDDRADEMRSDAAGVRTAAAVAEEARHRVAAARLERPAEDVAFGHGRSITRGAGRGGGMTVADCDDRLTYTTADGDQPFPGMRRADTVGGRPDAEGPRRRKRRREPLMHLGRLLLRVAVGEVFVVHGSQKLFGKFGGYGLEGTGGFFESLGLRPGRRHALAAGLTETAGGSMLVLGLATPAAAAGLTAVMITALRTAVWKDGVKPATGEFEVLLAAAALALADIGPGPLSLDAARGRERSAPAWALAAPRAGAAGAATGIAAGRRQPPPAAQPAEATPAQAATAGAQPQ